MRLPQYYNILYLNIWESSIQYSSNSIAYILSVEIRRKIVSWICLVGRLTYQAGGMKIVVRGKQASRSEAPILVLAPHSTFIDGGIAYVTGFPSIIVRRESGLNPFIGSRWYTPVSFNFFSLSSYIYEFTNNSKYSRYQITYYDIEYLCVIKKHHEIK